ncbi:heterokaryon incompatibility protein-domain-containing protein [Podospora aff. communis PSN243]|uniref:Heterokaryon incompatibility protein-domain-containing protein n=1 Tax=Podospora aff. communis PSN243 TaxID=3040156 RepID=A0AAV9GLK6_9PEZI|nr:heterokaryon incompatibility protein-domain-containing protein [Podospora aff. communis PSN243]
MAFSHVPLTGDEIRHLTVLPGQSGSTIRCELQNISLGDYSVHPEGIYRWSNGGIHWVRPVPEPGVPVPDDLEWPLQSGPESVTKTIDHDALPKFFGASPSLAGLPLVPEYEALSYTWGDSSQKRTIGLNGIDFDVTTNLHAALNRLRLPDSKRLLWVDAICIDQTNTDERAAQVPRMREIYQRAQRVVIWLGMESQDSSLAMSVLEGLGGSHEQTKDIKNKSGEWYGPQYDLMRAYGREASEANTKRTIEKLSELDLMSPGDVTEEGWAAMEKLLLERPYWKRVWIIQEVAYAREVIIHCGEATLAWSAFEYLPMRSDWRRFFKEAERFRLAALESGVVRLLGSRSESREVSRKFGFEKESTTLLNRLTDFWDYGSTDPRDKIYALLGLPAIDYDIVLPKVDYKANVATVFSQVALAIMEHERTLDILCLPHPDSENRKFGLPSWVPDWTTKPSTVPILRMYSGLSRSFKAAGDSVPCGPSFRHGAAKRLVDEWSDAPLFDMELVEADRSEEEPALKRHAGKGQLKEAEKGRTGRESSGKGYIMRGSERLGSYGGLSDRRFDGDGNEPTPFDPTLSVNGIKCGTIMSDCEEIPLEAFKTDEWRTYLSKWEDMFHPDSLFDMSDEQALPPHADFLWTMLKGEISHMPGIPGIPWRQVLYDQYVTWSGRKELSESPWSPLFPRLRDIGEVLLERMPGWKFGMVSMGMTAMVPSRAREGDVIIVLFGADVPIVLRPVEGSTGQYTLVGAAYIHGLMYGSALEELEKGEVTEETFGMDISDLATLQPKSVAVRNVSAERQEDIDGANNLVNDISTVGHPQPTRHADVAVGLHNSYQFSSLVYLSVFAALKNQSPVVVASVSTLVNTPSALYRSCVPSTYGGVLLAATSSVKMAQAVVSYRLRVKSTFRGFDKIPAPRLAVLKSSV